MNFQISFSRDLWMLQCVTQNQGTHFPSCLQLPGTLDVDGNCPLWSQLLCPFDRNTYTLPQDQPNPVTGQRGGTKALRTPCFREICTAIPAPEPSVGWAEAPDTLALWFLFPPCPVLSCFLNLWPRSSQRHCPGNFLQANPHLRVSLRKPNHR